MVKILSTWFVNDPRGEMYFSPCAGSQKLVNLKGLGQGQSIAREGISICKLLASRESSSLQWCPLTAAMRSHTAVSGFLKWW